MTRLRRSLGETRTTIAPEGTEQPAKSSEKPGVGQESGAESGAVGAGDGVTDCDLTETAYGGRRAIMA